MKNIIMKRMSVAILVLVCVIGGCIFAFLNVQKAKANNGDEIIPYTREEGSGTKSAFLKMTNLEETNWLGEQKDTTSKNIAIIGSSEEMIVQVSNTQNGLGFVSYAVAKDSNIVKALTVDGVQPTIDNIKNETYPLTRDFRLVYNNKMTDIEKDFLQYIKSEGQGYISNFCVPAREKGIFLPNGAEGKLAISGSTSMTPMMKELAKRYMEVNPKAIVEVKSSDSECGMLDVLKGDSNFGMVSRELKGYEKSLLSSERIGRDAITMIVNKNNGVNDIAFSQLRKIYNGSIDSWEYLKVHE